MLLSFWKWEPARALANHELLRGLIEMDGSIIYILIGAQVSTLYSSLQANLQANVLTCVQQKLRKSTQVFIYQKSPQSWRGHYQQSSKRKRSRGKKWMDWLKKAAGRIVLPQYEHSTSHASAMQGQCATREWDDASRRCLSFQGGLSSPQSWIISIGTRPRKQGKV